MRCDWQSRITHSKMAKAAAVNSCMLEQLPPEILFEVFRNLPLDEVGRLALVNRRFLKLTMEYLESKSCLKRAVASRSVSPLVDSNLEFVDVETLWHAQTKARFSPFAILCKRATCLIPFRERITICMSYIDKALEYQRVSLQHKSVSKDWQLAAYVIQFFSMLHTVLHGWDKWQFKQVLKQLDQKFALMQHANSLLFTTDIQNGCLESEMYLRLMFRCLAWDCAGNNYAYRATWLSCILSYFAEEKLNQQAMILMLLFGDPCRDNERHYDQPDTLTPHHKAVLMQLNNHTDWRAFTETIPTDFREGQVMFLNLAQAICSFKTNFNKSSREMKTVVMIMDQLFKIPSAWSKENIAGFLLFCCEEMIIIYLSTLADQDGDEFTVAIQSLVAHMYTRYFRRSKLSSCLEPSQSVIIVILTIINQPEL